MCIQLQIYVAFYIIQAILALAVFHQKLNGHNIIGALLTGGVIYLLCKFKYKLIANIVVGLLITMAVLGDVALFMTPDIVNTLNIEQAGVKKGVDASMMNTY